MKKYLLIVLIIGLTFIVFSAYQRSIPIEKDADIYKDIKAFSPYYVDKRIGGLTILSKSDEEFKQKPSNIEVFHVLDKLEQSWGKRYLKILDSQLIVMDDNNKTIGKIVISTKKDRDFLYSFYGVQ